VAITPVTDVRACVYKFNAPHDESMCGWTETRFLPADVAEDEAKAIATKLLDLRLRFLHKDASCVHAVTSLWSAPNKTRKIIPASMPGLYPPDDRDTFSSSTISVAPASPSPTTGVDNTNLVFDTALFFDYDDPETTSRFRIEGSGAVRANYDFHLVPDVFVDQLRRIVAGGTFTWVDPSATPTEPTVKEPSANFFSNMYDYFTYMKKFFRLVTYGDAGGYNLHNIDGVFFEGCNNRDVGRPFKLPRGRSMQR